MGRFALFPHPSHPGENFWLLGVRSCPWFSTVLSRANQWIPQAVSGPNPADLVPINAVALMPVRQTRV